MKARNNLFAEPSLPQTSARSRTTIRASSRTITRLAILRRDCQENLARRQYSWLETSSTPTLFLTAPTTPDTTVQTETSLPSQRIETVVSTGASWLWSPYSGSTTMGLPFSTVLPLALSTTTNLFTVGTIVAGSITQLATIAIGPLPSPTPSLISGLEPFTSTSSGISVFLPSPCSRAQAQSLQRNLHNPPKPHHGLQLQMEAVEKLAARYCQYLSRKRRERQHTHPDIFSEEFADLSS